MADMTVGRIAFAPTPGPWAVHPLTAQVDGFATGEPVPVCKLLWPTAVRSEDETEANGHLIAAAPDLLAACKSALAAFEHNHAIDWDDLARAIAKAEGQE